MKDIGLINSSFNEYDVARIFYISTQENKNMPQSYINQPIK